jgi:hypothetical protein
VDLGFFYDDLAPYGNWIERPNYGWTWTPRSVSASWQPYQNGHWVWTDQGWTWVTDEPYGWATYHYGRWYDDPEIGWTWVPGNDWAPAWVSFQEGGDYVGWAPLPPSVEINPGFSGGLSVSLAPETYVFVQERYFLAPSITTYIVPRERAVTVYRQTRNVSDYRYSGDRIYNQGIPVDHIQRAVGRPVTRYQLADLSAGQRRNGARIQGNQVQIFRPQVQRAARVTPPPSRPAARTAVVSAAQFQQSHPDRAARRAAAQGTSAPAVQPAPAPRAGRQPRTPPADQGQPAAQARPRGRNQSQPEVANPGRQRQVQPQQQPDQPQRQRPAAPPKRERPQVQQQQQPPAQQPPARERQQRQRPSQDNPPPPQQRQRQVEPQQQRQQPPPPQQQQKQQQRQERQQQKKEKQPPPPPPPSR